MTTRAPGPAFHYPYATSPSGIYVLEYEPGNLDWREVARGTEGEMWDHLHRAMPCSVEHALRHEGWKMTPVEAYRPALHEPERRAAAAAEADRLMWGTL